MTFLAEPSSVDPQPIGLLGDSFGAAVAIYAALINKRVVARDSMADAATAKQTFAISKSLRKFIAEHYEKYSDSEFPTTES